MTTTRYTGYPDASETGGHMVKMNGGPGSKSPWTFTCQDCGTTGNGDVFTVGLRGCPKRPESLNYLTVRAGNHQGEDPRLTVKAVSDQYRDFARRIGMAVEDWEVTGRKLDTPGRELPDGRVSEVWEAATFTFEGRVYRLIFDSISYQMTAVAF